MIKFSCENNQAFTNALSFLREQKAAVSVGAVIKAFRSEFNGYVFLTQSWDWEYYAFANERDATVFMLRFSS